MKNHIPLESIREMQDMSNKAADLMEMADALQRKVDSYTVENTSYNLLDHKTDCKILVYLNDKIQDMQLRENLIRIINQSKCNQVDDADPSGRLETQSPDSDHAEEGGTESYVVV